MSQKGSNETMEGARPGVKISRDFDHPREAVYRMLTQPNKAAGIWSPEGAVQELFELDPKPGGSFRIHDRDGEGHVHKTTGTVVDISPPGLLVVKTSTAPASGAAPWEALQTVTLEELGPKRTRLTVIVRVLSKGSFPGGVESLEEGFQGGWGEVIEKMQRALR